MSETKGPKDRPAAGPQAAGHGRRLLAWYDAGHRDLPWRAAPGKAPDLGAAPPPEPALAATIAKVDDQDLRAALTRLAGIRAARAKADHRRAHKNRP